MSGLESYACLTIYFPRTGHDGGLFALTPRFCDLLLPHAAGRFEIPLRNCLAVALCEGVAEANL
jgi:hypothetical protein